ncbi:acetate--CoA ligase [Candidatus Woesearchaeota archaeon]|nr:acetate--CoA ligase [Candidatus Woesearchaeota archaeon]
MNSKKPSSITSLMDEQRRFPPSKEFSEKAHIKSMQEYKEMYKESIENPPKFWNKMAGKLIDWYEKPDPDNIFTWDVEEAKHTWFKGAKLNVTYNCLDRHLKTWRKNKAALIWEGEPGDVKTYTYQQLHYVVCKFANVLKKKGVKKGDRVITYLPMIPELAISILACARIGAVHSVVFGGFSAESLKDRILDCDASVVLTSDGSLRRGKVVHLKKSVDEALKDCPGVKTAIVVKRAENDIEMMDGRDTWWHEEIDEPDITAFCEPEVMDAEDPFFILYTSGTTGKPKGVLHTTAGYLLYVTTTFKYIFDYKDDDVYWCTADIGWITGHSYIVYGPLANGATSLMFEGVPNYPNKDRFWEVVEKYGINIFYTAPTAIRAIAAMGDEWVTRRDLSSLRLLGSVGEPINPEAWMWYHKTVGKEKCPIVDTYWQSETGGVIITPLPGAMTLKPGAALRPFLGIEPKVIKEDGSPAKANEGGYLIIKKPWPGMMRTVYGDHQRWKETYWTRFPGVYFTGDGARIDKDGDFWLMGRIDDVVNVSGHRIGTAEVESALVSHPDVAEAAIVPIPHKIKGQGLYAFVTLNANSKKSQEELRAELLATVTKVIGPIAKPDRIQFCNGMPKTRSGKIMRRIMRKIAEGADKEGVGNTTTLADPSVVDELIEGRDTQ